MIVLLLLLSSFYCSEYGWGKATCMYTMHVVHMTDGCTLCMSTTLRSFDRLGWLWTAVFWGFVNLLRFTEGVSKKGLPA